MALVPPWKTWRIDVSNYGGGYFVFRLAGDGYRRERCCYTKYLVCVKNKAVWVNVRRKNQRCVDSLLASEVVSHFLLRSARRIIVFLPCKRTMRRFPDRHLGSPSDVALKSGSTVSGNHAAWGLSRYQQPLAGVTCFFSSHDASTFQPQGRQSVDLSRQASCVSFISHVVDSA
ncbi:hypothetical protein NDU88_003719 [Pleurodeles waltl]|uniref:Uncharacterized protein n=1 Tax=Pleurodeles waltl TaxID=8319 RepID=A0AAV7SGQ2_PLEWA|nr:hypothetical protein NDU88_003719 [Pleurodeles waltl]